MRRWRTAHNRRRARRAKARGLYVLQLCPTPPSWAMEQLVVTMDSVRAEIHRAMGVPAAFLSSGPRL